MAYRIFIDQGHNPQNPNAGAEGNGLREQDLVYTIGVLTAQLLNADPDFEARLSRNAPDEILGTSVATSLQTRVQAANEWNADFFISLHANASAYPEASGCEGYAYSTSSQGFPMGQSILTALSEATGLQNRGMFTRPTLYVLRRTRMPAALIELGFITNAGDASLMQNQPQLFADGICQGIRNYYGF